MWVPLVVQDPSGISMMTDTFLCPLHQCLVYIRSNRWTLPSEGIGCIIDSIDG